MKQTYIRILAVLAVSLGMKTLNATEPRMVFGEALSGISPNGEWVAGQITDGSVVIRNLVSDQVWAHFASGLNNYYIGYGSPVSDIGVIAGATTTSNAAYWENGRWHLLPVPNRDFISNAVSITPDGGIICGGVGMEQFGGDTESTMLYPALWHRLEDGTYSDPEILPHPSLDLTGRAPQYISAIAISEDGRTVAGEITDYFGARTEPIYYYKENDGTWSYKRLGENMLNPSGIVFPEWPGGLDDDILMPTQEWYMTEEQIEAFVEAFNEWDNTGEPPRYEDFMTPEQIAQYQKDLQEYYEIALPWREKYDKFMEVYMRYLNQGISFGRNQARLSPDGKKYVTTAGGQPVIFDLDSDEITILPTAKRVSVTSVTADYSLLAFVAPSSADAGTYKAYIFPKMAQGGLFLEDYIKDINPELFSWMESHLFQDVITGINAEGTFNTEEMMCTGIPVATPDMSYIVTNNSTASWLDDPGEEYVSLILPVLPAQPDDNAVEEILLSQEYESVIIYDINGQPVWTINNTKASADSFHDINLHNLPKGLYIIKAYNKDGNCLTQKICH